jgi:hypothetical protein
MLFLESQLMGHRFGNGIQGFASRLPSPSNRPENAAAKFRGRTRHKRDAIHATQICQDELQEGVR